MGDLERRPSTLHFSSRHLFSERIDEEERAVQKRHPAENRHHWNT
jgi:hypothetical protein